MAIKIEIDKDEINKVIKEYIEEQVKFQLTEYLDKNALLPFIRGIVHTEMDHINSIKEKRIQRIKKVKQEMKKEEEKAQEITKAEAFQIFT